VPSPDPWVVLGLAPGASLEEARAARRRLAKELHPDLHGDQERAGRMTLVNQALTQIEAGWSAPPELAAAEARETTPPGTAEGGAARVFPADSDSFSLDWLPAEAFEALFLAAYGLGDILVADEPYLLEVYLAEPACFCRLTLAPEAGGSLVTVDVSPPADALAAPETAIVIGVLVAELNALVAG